MAKILLVEDDKSLREIYGVRLQAEGYEIASAGDGEEALAMAIKEHPDLIVSDVMMPKISGFDMLDILRSTTETKNVKVIMMTALSSDDQRARGESLGADRYLVKSQVGIEDVVRTVHDVLADNAAAAPAPAVEPAAEQPVAPIAAPAPVTIPAPAPEPTPAPVAFAPAPVTPEPTPTPTPTPAPIAFEPVALPQAPAPTPQPAAPVFATPAPVPAPQPQAPVTQPVAPAPVQASAYAPEPFTAQPTAAPAPVQAFAPVAPAPAPQPFVQPAPVDTPISAPVTPQAPVAPVQPFAPTPTPEPSQLPQPTAPFSSPAPASLGERVIQPLTDPLAAEAQNFSLSSQIDAALNTQAPSENSGTPPVPPSV